VAWGIIRSNHVQAQIKKRSISNLILVYSIRQLRSSAMAYYGKWIEFYEVGLEVLEYRANKLLNLTAYRQLVRGCCAIFASNKLPAICRLARR
jgi:hypothetical protein